MSQPPGNENVARNNDRLFSIYEDHLRIPNVKEYGDTATKLAAWLGDSKAYYTAARPRIVKLLITAQMTLQEAVGYVLDIATPFLPAQYLHHPLTASYVGLVQAIAPFRNLFVEPHLSDAVAHLLQSVEGISIPDAFALSPPASTSQQHPAAPSPLSSARNARSSTQDTRVPEPSVTMGQSSPSGSSHFPDDNLQKTQITPRGRNRTLAGSYKAITAEALETPLQHSVPATVPNHIQPTTTSIRRSPSPEIVFLGTSKSAANEDGACDGTTPPTTSTPNSLNTGHAPKHSGKVKAKKKRKVDIAAFVQSDLQDFKQKQAHAQRQTLESIPFIKKEPETEQVPLVVNAGKQADNDAVATAPTSVQQPATTQALPSCHNPVQSGTPTPPSAQSQPRHKYAPIQAPQTFARPMDSALATSPEMLASQSIDASSNPLMPLATTQQTQEHEPPQIQIPRPFMISEDSGLARLFRWYEEYRFAKRASEDNANKDVEMSDVQNKGETRDNTSLVEDIATLDLAAQESERWFQVVALTPGHTQDTCMEFTLDIAQPSLDPVLKWLNRSTLPLKELRSSYCLSLGCYSSQELMKHLGNKLELTTDARVTKAIASSTSTWPQNGGLTMNVSFGGSRKDLPLAPPLIVTGDGFVDVSEFVALGKNSILIHQQERDFTDYTFVLHVHHPTFKQLQEIVEHRKKEVEWKDWLVDITRPLEINVPARALAPNTPA